MKNPVSPQGPEMKQSQSPFEDPDTPVLDFGKNVPRPLQFHEMVHTRKNARQPHMDMDTDLGA